MNDAVALAILVVGIPLMLFAVVTWFFHFFVALRAPPSRRAVWTVGVASLIVTPVCMSSAPPEYAIYAPAAVIPAGLIAFWAWRAVFRQGWVADGGGLPETELANEDWRIGLIIVTEIVVNRAFRALLELVGP
jgi:hypothetical protein